MCSYSGWFIPVASSLLFCTVQITPRAAAQSSCTVTYDCQSNFGCASVMGGQVTRRSLNYADQNACVTAASAASVGHPLPVISCNCGDGTAPNATEAANTGSLTGDVLNLGANLWIIQNVKNPYTAVFAQHFTQSFLTGLFSAGDPEAQRQQQLALEAVQRQQQEAAERARIAEQQRIDAMFIRLNSQLKLSGNTTQLSLKTNGPLADLPMKLSSSGSDKGLRLKLGDGSTNGSSIQGLPGINVGGSSDTSDNSGGLKLKLGDSSAPASPITQPVPPMGIRGLPGLNLNNVEPSQAAQLADTATTLTGPERSVVEDAALQAAQKNPALTAPSDDPFITDYQKEAQGYDAAMQQQQRALQKASEAEGHVQADKAALDYASKIVQSPDAIEAQKQAFQQMQSAARSDENAAVAARQMFEQTDVHLSIVRDRASDALAGLAPLTVNLGGLTNRVASATTSAPGAHAAASPLVVGSSAVPVLSPSARPEILATPPPGGKPYVMTVNECVASYSPAGSFPALEELQNKLESTITAMERIAKSQQTENDINEDWSKELRNAHMDIFNNATDALLDGLLGVTNTSLEKYKKSYQEGLEVSVRESQQLRAEYLAAARNPLEQAAWQAKKAGYLARSQIQLEKGGVLEDAIAEVKQAKSTFEKIRTGRDLYLWLTDNEVIPCKFADDDKINCDNFKKNNGVTKFAQGDMDRQLELLKQVMKFGVHYAPSLKAFSYGSFIGETYDATSLAIDVTYDGLAIYYSKKRLLQVKQNGAQFDRAREVLGDRIDRLNAEIACYQGK
jgi:hypothetical protein